MPSRKLISNVNNGMETISVNIPFLDLADYLPGKRAHGNFRTIENVRVTNNRLLGKAKSHSVSGWPLPQRDSDWQGTKRRGYSSC